MQGTVIFLKSFLGTKSESLQPYLYLGKGETLRIYKNGDNPFENESLRPFDGKEVVIDGTHNDKGVLEVEMIEVLERPLDKEETVRPDEK